MALTEVAQAHLARRLAHIERVRDRVVMDGDTHPSDLALIPPEMRSRMQADPGYFHMRPITGPELLAELDMSCVDMALSWQNPACTPYGDDPRENFRILLAANRYCTELAREHPTRIVNAGWTDPRALGLDGAIELARILVEEFGCSIVKMNPGQNAYPIDSAEVLATVDAIVALGAVPAFHFGGDTPYTPPDGLETVAARHPDHPVIGVHMGGGGSLFPAGDATYLGARALGLRQRNVFYVLSAIRDTHVESNLIAYALAEPSALGNIAMGSDAPYGRVSWNYGGIRQMFASLGDPRHPDPRLRGRPGLFDEAAVRGVMGRNLADLLIAADRRVLARGGAA